jgi:hypothetical protein
MTDGMPCGTESGMQKKISKKIVGTGGDKSEQGCRIIFIINS